MKKLSLFHWASIALIFLHFSNQSIAQPPPNLSLSEQMDYLMAPLDFTEVTSGLLLDKGFPMMEIAAYDGTTSGDTIKEYGDWFRQFGTMVTSKTGTTSPIGVTADYKPQADSLLKSGVIPIMVLHAEYHKFISDSTALSALITFQNNQLNDVAGRTSSPYQLHEIVSFSPKQNKFYDKLSHDFRINADFIRTNTAKTISTIEIDFDNGSGYQTFSLGSNSKITWGTFGKKIIKLRITYTDSSVYHAKSQIELVDKSGGQPKYNSTRDETVYIPHPTIANHGVELAIAYGCGNNNELRKPFIYVEGFNPDLFGDQFYEEDFFDDFDDYQDFWIEGFPLLSELDENGYDVVYVDFDRGDGSLIENAKALQAAINWINEEKAANCSTSDNILVGYSMGGVVARLALTYMEDDAEDHEVSYYVSVDSPHRGANIPRAIIAALIDIRNFHHGGFAVSEDVPEVEDAFQVLFSPAAKQMLLYSGEGSNTLITGHGPTFTSFQNHVHNEQGMPTQTLENIAIAKGGGAGVGQFDGMAPILDINTSTFNALSCFTDVPGVAGWFAGAFALLKLGLYSKVVLDINGMPGNIPSSLEIYERKIRLLATTPIIPIPYFYWDSHNTDAQGVDWYDGVQGGTYGLENFIDLEDDEDDLADFINNVIDGDYEPCLELKESKFSFIPTASALDLEDYMNYTGASPNAQINPNTIVSNGETPFQKTFILDPTKYPSGSFAPTNESHLDLTPSNVFPFSAIIPPAFTTNAIGTIDGFTYNHGRAGEADGYVETSNRITRLINVGVNQSGSLCVNCTGVLGNSAETANPQNEADHFTVELTKNCGFGFGRLNIGADGILKVGENSGKTGTLVVRGDSWIELNNGLIEVREGSKLIIEAGGELRLNGGQVKVYDGGEIVVKEGGLLIYEDGVTIELNGNDAQLALGGHTHIGANATFRFFWQGSESGYVRLLKEGYWGQRFSAGNNASVRLEGSSKDDLILHMEEDADFWEYSQDDNFQDHGLTSENFALVLFKDGNIVCEKNSRFVFKAKTAFADVKIEQLSSFGGDRPRGIVTYAQLNFHQSDAYRIDIAGKFNVSGQGYLKFESSTFERSNISIRGGSFDFASSVFDNLSIEEEETVHTSRFTSSHLSGWPSIIVSKSLQELRVVGSSVTYLTRGIQKHGGRLTVRCSEFRDNFEFSAISLFDNARLDMNLRNGAGYNVFQDNLSHIKVDYSVFNIGMGYNQFYYDAVNATPQSSIIHGRVGYTPGSVQSDYLISAIHNTWTPYGQSPNPAWPDPAAFEIEVYHDEPLNSQVMFYVPFDFGQVMPPTECGLYDYPADPPPVEGPKNGSENTISSQTVPLMSGTVYFDGLQFDEALQTVSNLLIEADTAEADMQLIADMYFDLLSSVPDCNEPDSACKALNQMCFEALHGYKSAIEIMFKEEELTIDENQASFQPTVSDYASTLMSFTDSVKTPENHFKQFDLEMMKVSLFRGIQKYDQALSILINMEQCEHDSIREVIIDSQIQNILFDQHVHSEGVSYDLENESSFELDSSLFHLYAQSIIDTSGFGSYIIGPNNLMFTHCEIPVSGDKSLSAGNAGTPVEIFPNPTLGEVQVRLNIPEFSSDDAVYLMQLHDLSGRIVFSEVIRSTDQSIVLPNLQRSIYISSVSRGDERIFRGKLTVM